MDKRKRVVLVDDQLSNLSLGKKVLADEYEVLTVPSGEMLFLLLNKITPDIILLDVEMPTLSGYETLKILKSNPKTEAIPVIFLTSMNNIDDEIHGLSLGAIDYISKPFSPPILKKRIEIHLLVEVQKQALKNYNDNLERMVEKKTSTIFELQNAILEIIADLVESRDHTTGGHIKRTQKYLNIMIEGMLEKKIYYKEILALNIKQFISSAGLHDVGKISISDSILKKTCKLTEEEFNEMKMHTIMGEKIIEHIQERTSGSIFLEYAKVLAVSHHERWDGSGYPYGLKGMEIPLVGRMMAFADVYDALVSERPYKKAYSHEVAIKIIKENRGTQFEPILTDLFLELADKFHNVTK